jgi:hypothetical protein
MILLDDDHPLEGFGIYWRNLSTKPPTRIETVMIAHSIAPLG